MRLAIERSVGKLSVIALPLMLLFAISITGCANLEAVRKFTASYKSADSAFPAIVADMYGACANNVDYTEIADNNYDVKKIVALESDRCGKYRQLAPRLIAANRILFEYLTALAAMADDTAPASDADLDGLAGKLNGAPDLNPDQVKAFSALAKFVTDATTDAYRRAELAKAIEANNDNVAVVTRALNTIVVEDYGTLLNNEETGLRDMYGTPLRNLGSQQPLNAVLVANQWRGLRDQIETRRTAADAYGKILTEIAAGHNELNENRTDLGSRETAAALLRRAAAISDLAATMSGAF